MIRLYAQFSQKNPAIHCVNLGVMFLLVLLSTYQLLANEQLEYAIGLMAPILPMFIFAKASDYRRKYLHD